MADFLLVLPVLLFSVVAHEFAHAWTAHLNGDDTGLKLGRMTFNPLPHLDPFGSVILPIVLWIVSKGTFTFGAARPVPVNPGNYRDRVRGDLIVSSAGVAANLVLAVVSAAAFVVLGVVTRGAGGLAGVAEILQRMAVFGIQLNVLLAFFNILPVPPLDGSHLMIHALPRRWVAPYMKFGRYAGLALLAAFFFVPGVWDVVLWPVGAVTHLAQSTLGAYSVSHVW